MRLYFLLLAGLAGSLPLFAQGWEKAAAVPGDYTPAAGRPPKHATLFRTSTDRLRERLLATPHEDAAAAAAAELYVPQPDGGLARFLIRAYHLQAPEDAARFPGIRTWYGHDPSTPGRTIFLDWTARGFHASVSGGGRPGYTVDPVATDRLDYYRVTQKANYDPGRRKPFDCRTGAGEPAQRPDGTGGGKSLDDCRLREYTTAVAATAEYSRYHGANSPADAALVQSAVVTTLNRVNQIYSRDLGIRLRLVAGNDRGYFYDPHTDPYPLDTVSRMILLNTEVLDDLHGRGAYQLGHVFACGSRNTGVAFFRSTCGGSRGGGATSLIEPAGDAFAVDYVAHEIGHQFGANHTQNNNCNYSTDSGVEPGSGSTIMGYAGICAPNVQDYSDDYFHGRSIEEIGHFVNQASGGCGAVVNEALRNPNVRPAADATIPAGTPFILRGRALSADPGTNLTYGWEQHDRKQGTMPPRGENPNGPLFRSYAPTSNPERSFPRLADVLTGAEPVWERLPTVTRAMTFRATVRNASAAYGCTARDEVLLTVNGTAGPFTVTDPSDGNHWSAGQIAQVRWDVAGTTAPPINSARVDIYLSADGGASWALIQEDTPNDGYTQLPVPAVNTERARIMVRSADNYFYQVSRRDFRIAPVDEGPPTLELRPLSSLGASDCFSENRAVHFDFVTDGGGGASDPIRWRVTDLPPGVVASFDLNPTRPGGRFTLTLSGWDRAEPGSYAPRLVGESAQGQLSQELGVNKLGRERGAGPAILGPPAAGGGTDLRPTLTAAPTGTAGRYEFQLADTSDFSRLLLRRETERAEVQLPDYLDAERTYYWRVRQLVDGGCGSTAWRDSSFTTAGCRIFASRADSVVISDGPPVNVSTMPLEVPEDLTVGDLDVHELDITHSYLADLRIELIGPEGRRATVYERSCGNRDNIFASFDDEAAGLTPDCPPTGGDFFRPPGGQLYNFDGAAARGQWTLRVADLGNRDGGHINGFKLKICPQAAVLLPVTWLAFTATARKDHVALDWRTADERDNYGFFVERSAGARGPWRELGFVAAGTDYRFADRTVAPATDYFYRLRQEDLDGRVSYSDIRSARIGGGGGPALLVFPNPAAGRFHYRRTEARPVPLDYQLTDARGRALADGELSAGGGTLDLSARPAGLYYLRLLGGNGPQTIRLVKL